MKTQRIVMLDIDGVINRDGQWYGDIAVEARLAHRVGQLVAQCDAQVVISSDWRHFYGLEDLRSILNYFGSIPAHRVLGTTHVPRVQGTGIRGQEIQQWLQTHGQPARLVILDDNYLGRFCMAGVWEWFVKTNPRYGITKANLTQAQALLTDGPVWSAVQSSAA